MSQWYDTADAKQRVDGIDAARKAVQRGELVVLPTDTVYGVGTDAFAPVAVSALLACKGRGRDMPVPVLVGSWQTLDGLVYSVPTVVKDLVQAFWPGGLTIIVRHAASLSWDLGDSHGTVGVRMPSHPVALDLLTRTGPMAVSSANRSGQPPATRAEQAREQLGEQIAVYLDAGPCAEPVPSTIVDATGPSVIVRRVGALSVERLREVAPDVVVPDDVARAAGAGSGPAAGDPPGAPAADGDRPGDGPASTTGVTEPAGGAGAAGGDPAGPPAGGAG